MTGLKESFYFSKQKKSSSIAAGQATLGKITSTVRETRFSEAQLRAIP